MAQKYTYTKEKRDPQIQWYKTESGKRWRVKFSIVKLGKRHYIQKNGFTSFEDARLAKAHLMSDIETKTFTGNSNITVKEYWEYYSKTRVLNGSWNDNSYKAQSSIFRVHILPKWGKTKLIDINRNNFQDWINDIITNNDYTKGTIEVIVLKMSSLMNDAALGDVIPKNPIRKIKVNGRDQRNSSMTKEQYTKVVQLIMENPNNELTTVEQAVGVLAIHGLRKGEIAGIKLKYVKPDKIGVFGQLKTFGVYDTPKSKSSNRWVPLIPGAYEILNKVILEDRKILAKQNRMFLPDDFILIKYDGNHYSYCKVETTFRKISKIVGFNVWPHKMRHAFSTFAFSLPGVNPKDIMQVLGHTNLDMSMYYNNGTEEGKEKLINEFGNTLEI